MALQFQKAKKKQAKLRLEIQGPSGSGKTWGALLIATHLAPNKVAFIDTEASSAAWYADKFDFDHLNLEDCSPEGYIAAIEAAEQAGYECVIIDSLSHEWERLMEIKDEIQDADPRMDGFRVWGKLTPRHNKLVQRILNSRMHVISCTRTKTEYVIEKNDRGKNSPRKVGTKSVQREGLDYEFTVVFELSNQHYVTCTKDRTSEFIDRDPFVIDEDVAQKLKACMDDGQSVEPYFKKIDELAENLKISAEKVDGAKQYIEKAADFDAALAQIQSKWENNNK